MTVLENFNDAENIVFSEEARKLITKERIFDDLSYVSDDIYAIPMITILDENGNKTHELIPYINGDDPVIVVLNTEKLEYGHKAEVILEETSGNGKELKVKVHVGKEKVVSL